MFLRPLTDDPNRFFPVLYLHDGQNLFDPETSFIKGNYWRVGETADALIASGEDRAAGDCRHLQHRRQAHRRVHARRRQAAGRRPADAYGQMLVEELRPFVAHQYRTLAGAENCGMGGSSLGGLVTSVSRHALSRRLRQTGHPVALGVVARSRDSYGTSSSFATRPVRRSGSTSAPVKDAAL